MPSSAKLLEKLRPCGTKRLNMFSSGSEGGVRWNECFKGIVGPKIKLAQFSTYPKNSRSAKICLVTRLGSPLELRELHCFTKHTLGLNVVKYLSLDKNLC